MRQDRRLTMNQGLRMAKKNLLLGPGSACSACHRVNWDIGSEGDVCYHCRAGIFMHRRFWQYTFDAKEALVGVAPNPTVTDAERYAEYLRLAASYARWPWTIPPLLSALIREAETHLG